MLPKSLRCLSLDLHRDALPMTIFHSISKAGIWSVDELIKEVPEKLTNDLPLPQGLLGF